MSEQRSTGQRTADVLAVLGRNGDAWLATASPAGRPHLIAASAWWDGELVVIATTSTSRTARNLDETKLGRLSFGSPDDAILVDVGLVDSQPAGDPEAALNRGFAAAVGWDPAGEDGDWRLFRLRPARIQAYRGYGDQRDREVMRDGRWLA